MRLGLRFGEPDFWSILNDWPAGLFEYWWAFYLLEPWDAANSKALAECKYQPPSLVTRKGRFMDNGELWDHVRAQGK